MIGVDDILPRVKKSEIDKLKLWQIIVFKCDHICFAGCIFTALPFLFIVIFMYSFLKFLYRYQIIQNSRKKAFISHNFRYKNKELILPLYKSLVRHITNKLCNSGPKI